MEKGRRKRLNNRRKKRRKKRRQSGRKKWKRRTIEVSSVLESLGACLTKVCILAPSQPL